MKKASLVSGSLLGALLGMAVVGLAPDARAAGHAPRTTYGEATPVEPGDVSAQGFLNYDLGWIPPSQTKNDWQQQWINPGVRVTVRVNWEPWNAGIRWGIWSQNSGFLGCQVPNHGANATWDCTVTTAVGGWYVARAENPQDWTSIHPWGSWWF